ncbi:MAG TPA: dTMP kinase [Leptolyngbyaceae cyanobacterium]
MGGKLIVFEGVEGSGKTTQLRRGSDWLQESGLRLCLGSLSEKTPVVVTREPGGTSLGLGLRQLLLEEHSSPLQDRTELLLYAADRAQHVEEVLKPQRALGAIILCDRYTDSTVAYQGYGRGLDLKLIQQLNQIATDGLESDLTLWLDIDAETGLKRARERGTADRIEQADLGFHQRVQQGFAELAASYPQRIVRIDASKSEEEVHLAIQDVLRQRLGVWFQTLSQPS